MIEIGLYDALAVLLANEYNWHTEQEWQDMYHLIRLHLDTGLWVALQSDDGKLEGFAAWIRTDETGAALIREYGFENLVRLAIPIQLTGPVLLLMYTVVMPTAQGNTLARLWAEVIRKNPEAVSAQTRIRPKGRLNYWLVRKIVRRK